MALPDTLDSCSSSRARAGRERMTVLVAYETVLLVLLVLLVAGLLRSHAEILRRLGPRSRTSRGCPSPARGAAGAGA